MKKSIYLIIAAAALISCSKSEPVEVNADELWFDISYPATKATASSFENGDAISLYAVEYAADGTQMPLQVGGNYLNNEKITCSGSSWTPDRKLFWSERPCDFYGIYPYQNVTSIESYPFTVATDQSGDGYEASDLLYAYTQNVSRSAGAVSLQFQHIMSKLVVKLEKGPKFEGKIPDDVVAHIYNTNVECTANFITGSVEKNAFGAKNTITMKKLSNEQFEAILVPQNLERRTPLIELTMGGIAYLLDYSLSFRAGYVHTVTITLNTSPDQEQIEISIDPSVNPWK